MAKVLEDLQSAWRWGRAPNLVTAMELVMWTLMVQRPDKVTMKPLTGASVALLRCYDIKPAWCVPAGHHTAAVADVEAENSKDWFVY